jgi:hypothetical protein
MPAIQQVTHEKYFFKTRLGISLPAHDKLDAVSRKRARLNALSEQEVR